MRTPSPSSVATFFIRTYGCQMNERDSEAVACMLEAHGLSAAAREADADVLLFNTCSVRDQAERKVLGKLGILKRLKRVRPDIIIGVFGCMAQRLGTAITDQMPHVDFVVGTDQAHRIPDILQEVTAGRRGFVETTQEASEHEDQFSRHPSGTFSAFVTVMRGCNQGCTYCVVPAVRGRERSRAVADIVAEVEHVVAQGGKEIFLLGQNITAYGIAEARHAQRHDPEASPFAELLRAVNAVRGVMRIRFTSPHPRHMNAAFVAAVAECQRVCDSFHVPVQSGADRILAAMRRGYTAAEYLARIDALRAVRPLATFSTDVIVGFPGETDPEFAATRELMSRVAFDMAYIFKYSPRPGTAAAGLPDDVPQAVKETRLQILLDDLERRVQAQNQRCVGQVCEVLVEGPSLRNPQRWAGRSSTNKVVIFPPAPAICSGDLIRVRIDRATSHSLFGEPA